MIVPFILTEPGQPGMDPVNLISADSPSDVFWKVKHLNSQYVNMTTKYYYVDKTIYVLGLYSGYHLSHWLFNGVIPAFR
jgi:hypothetical protein